MAIDRIIKFFFSIGYDTDYSELYIGLAVVLGFFILLVLFLLMMFTIIYLRRKYCKKQSRERTQNIVASNNETNGKLSTIVIT
jgi:Na+-transporting methylmalonyl-CoA/oxaloacetate decarboxylase gamma subunit